MTPLLLSVALFAPAVDPTPKEGVLPLGTDGKPLNLDFESGTLKDWTAQGDAFEEQPIQGDTVKTRRADMTSGHQGKFWIGGFEKHGDKRKGYLNSVPFTVTHPWCSFLVAGGAHETETCVELIDNASNGIIFRTCGEESETLKRVAVDLSKFQGKRIRIRIVDQHTGHWGHINFDDFRFHSEKPDVPERQMMRIDEYKYAGQKPQDAAKNMTVPAGFKVDVIAAEPDLHQPIAFCWDDRGRLWVVEAFTYPKRHPEKGFLIPSPPGGEGGRRPGEGESGKVKPESPSPLTPLPLGERGTRLGDRFLILEDTNGDGTFDKRTVFMEGLNLVSGIELGFGGVWVGAAPYLLFIPILENDKPGEVKILLDGWGYQDTHETLNSFIWGPDGWLYGCHGVFTHSNVGKPGAADEQRKRINAGIWRYHPTKHTFEVFAHGTSNPWGLDYNANGDFFIEACVIPHLWHIVQGGRYERQAGQHFNPYTYDAQIKTIAKHRHYVGTTAHGGNGRSDSAGGGHAHSGLMCYQGGAWPKEYHGKLFMGNLHGHRINVDEVKPKGASYEGDRNPDFLLSHDKHCIIVAIHAGPDGNIYFCDWSDKQVCHRNEVEIWDRTNGRLFRVSHKDAKPLKPFDLQKSTDAELVKLVTSDNEWMSRHARRILQERQVSRETKASAETRSELQQVAATHADPAKRLRALWTLHTLGEFDPKWLANVITNDLSPNVRGWAIRLAWGLDQPPTANGLLTATLNAVKAKDASPVVRREYASALLANRWFLKNNDPANMPKLIGSLFTHAADVDDPVLPHLYWYVLDGISEEQSQRLALELALAGKIPQLVGLAARKAGSFAVPEAIDPMLKLLATETSPARQLMVLQGIQDGLKGRWKHPLPANWKQAFPVLTKSDNAEVRGRARNLAVTLGDETIRAELRKELLDAKLPLTQRQQILDTLATVGDPELFEPLRLVVETQPDLRGAAVRALAGLAENPRVPRVLRNMYKHFTAAEKRDAIATLSSRASYAKDLLQAVADKTVPPTDIPAETIRQLRNLNDTALSAKIAQVWGVVRDTPTDRKRLIADYGKKLSQAVLAQADLGAGRAVYAKVCQQCHTLYGVGGKVGPEITGANRADLNYLLENIFDPSAVIPKEYAATKLDLEDGRVITGIIKEETATQLVVVTANETITVSPGAVAKRTPSDLSMMPDDLTKQLNDKQLRDLFGYLKHNAQVPLLANKDQEKEFFNGKDLTGWDGDKDVWSVENGEIVGKTKTGLKRNNFIKSTMEVTDFKLTVKVKLTPNKENSGIQFRSVPIEGGEMRGPQADIGDGWWGKLYEESARGLLVKGDNDKFVKKEDWNEYVIEAVGPKVRMWLNGEKVADYEDDKLAKRGLIAFQVHSGGPMEVRFKDIKLEVIETKK